MFPGDEKWDLWDRAAKLYDQCYAIADIVDGKPCFELRTEQRVKDFDPKTHQFWLRWEARIGGFYEHGQVMVGLEFRLFDNVADRAWSLLSQAHRFMVEARAASSRP